MSIACFYFMVKQFNTIKQDELERKNQELQIEIQNLAMNNNHVVGDLKIIFLGC
ncbi:MAG: hypothetical protein QXI33_02400 [Candidatus Pacearchaeota archaeon]